MGRPSIPVGGTGEIRAKQVKDRLWSARVRWRDDSGGYHRTVAEAASRRQCEDLARRRIQEERKQLRADRVDGLTLDEVAERWFVALQRSSRRPSTVAQYRATWRGTLAPVLGDVPVDALTRAKAQQVLLEGLFARRPGHRDGDGRWVPGEYRLDYDGHRIPLRGDQPRAVLYALCRFACDRGYRADGINPLDHTERPEVVRPPVRALTDEEADRVIAMAEHWYRTGHGASNVLWHGLVVLRFTGLRIGELLALTWGDVDLASDPPTVTARRTLLESRAGQDHQIGPTKGGTIDVIALHTDAANALASRRPNAPDPESFVFSTRTGRPVTAANFRRALRDLVEDDPEVRHIHPHAFRHTIGTKADRQLGLDAARDLLRHRQTHTSWTYYVEKDTVRVLDPRSLFSNETDGTSTSS